MVKRKITINLSFDEKEAEAIVREIELISGDRNFDYLNIEHLLELKEDLIWSKEAEK